jgi:hypothetical protein
MSDAFNNDDGCKFDFDYLFSSNGRDFALTLIYFQSLEVFGVVLLSEMCSGVSIGRS